jgi:Natural resistance-associated macrophage protein
MAFIQLMCARIGMVTGRGLAGALRQRCPRWLLLIAAAALLSANIITIGADLAGMSDAAKMLIGLDTRLLTIIFGAARHHLFSVLPNRFNLEMADVGSFRIRYYGVHSQAALGNRVVRHLHSILAAGT